jgi:hypothetical protein
MEDGAVVDGMGFQVFQLLRTNGATSVSHLQISCDCQAHHGAPPYASAEGTSEKYPPEDTPSDACHPSLHILTVTNAFGGRNDLEEGNGTQIWRFRARAANSDASMWRLQGHVGVFELLQTLPSIPIIASTGFRIEMQGCFFAYLARNVNVSAVLPDTEWMRSGESGGAVHLWRYQGGPAPTACVFRPGGNT